MSNAGLFVPTTELSNSRYWIVTGSRRNYHG